MKRLVYILLIISTLFTFSACKNKAEKYDVDFTSMNFEAASAVMFDLLIAPEKYNGKSVKISGKFNTSFYDGKEYYTVTIWDSTGCCPVALDFIPPKEMGTSIDFPSEDAEITILGKLVLKNIGDEDKLVFVAEKIF